MNSRVLIETILGFIVILVALTFVYIAYNSGNVSQVTDGYDINAKFTDASGLTIGSDVRISGIKIGNVTQQTIDQSDGLYQAMITLTIESAMKLPVDSSAAIVSESLLGGKYVSISPGGSDNFLKNGDSHIFLFRN